MLTALGFGSKMRHPNDLTLSSNTNKYNLFTAAGSPAGVVTINLTINSGVTV